MVQNLHSSLNNPDCRTEAAEIMGAYILKGRELIETLPLRYTSPIPDAGNWVSDGGFRVVPLTPSSAFRRWPLF